MPGSDGRRGRSFRNHGQVVEGIAYRFRCGIAWQEMPGQFGMWQTVWKRHRRFAADGTWHRINQMLLAEAEATGGSEWTVSVDSTINRAHQHGTNLPRSTGDPSNEKKPWLVPVDHAVARSRGGLTTKIHHACDGKGRPLAFILGQPGPRFALTHVRTRHQHGHRPSTRGSAGPGAAT
ncbi:IS5 family transposase [Arthrobacter sp. SDTb3-6]|nr:IS5 family transposase [Arthrobacter sp. SDTb3-6]